MDISQEEAEPMDEKASRNPTRVGRDVDQSAARRQTHLHHSTPAPDAGVKKTKGVDNRKIVGVLVSYTWRPEGELFAVREGRTHIGADQIRDDPEHREVEVQCPLDDLISGDHALILVQQGEFYIQDLASTNGTYVNGKKLRPESVEDLPNNAEIKAGKTQFSFVQFKPSSETPQPEVREPEKPARARTDLR
jgi:pSer/pThr/pTyr-binding forkhead associated (FHA) protein